MSQASATKLISKLRYKIHSRRNLNNPDGPKGRHDKIKKTITALLKHERIEMNYHYADEARGYAERLISEAIRHGDRHKDTMDMASYWIIEPQIVHKLFKVLAPRYTNFDKSYTKMWRAPNIYPGTGRPKCVLELRNNIYPSLEPDTSNNKNLIHNVLLEEARKVYRQEKAEMLAKHAELEKVQASKSAASQSEVKENVQSEPVVNGNADIDKMKVTDGANTLSSEDSIKADSVNEDEKKSEVNSLDSSLEEDLNKVKISDEKPKETVSEAEKK